MFRRPLRFEGLSDLYAVELKRWALKSTCESFGRLQDIGFRASGRLALGLWSVSLKEVWGVEV